MNLTEKQIENLLRALFPDSHDDNEAMMINDAGEFELTSDHTIYTNLQCRLRLDTDKPIKIFSGEFPDETRLSLVFDWHATNWINDLFDLDRVNEALFGHVIRQSLDGKPITDRLNALAIEIFPYIQPQSNNLQAGLIVHLGGDGNDNLDEYLLTENEETLARLIPTKAKGLMFPDGTYQPLRFVCYQKRDNKPFTL